MSLSRDDAWAHATEIAQALLGASHTERKALFSTLAEALWPLVVELALSSRALRASNTRADDAHEVATRLLEKLNKDEGEALFLYQAWQARHPERTFADWMRITTENALRDLLRQRRGDRSPSSGEPSIKQLLNEHAMVLKDDGIGSRPPFTPMHTARQIMDYASIRLPPAQVNALKGWLAEHTFEDIATAQSLTNELEAKRLVRAAVASLRRAFAEDGTP